MVSYFGLEPDYAVIIVIVLFILFFDVSNLDIVKILTWLEL